IVSIIVSGIGILKKFVAPVRAFIVANYPPISQSATVSDTELRIASTLQHFSGLGAYLTFTLILALACYTVPGQMKISRQLLAATFLFDSIALVLTGTIAAWIGLAVGVAVVFLLIIGTAMAVCWRQIKDKNDDTSRPVAIALFAILISISVMNFSGEYFTYVGGTQTIWTLLAILVASGQLQKLTLPTTTRFPA